MLKGVISAVVITLAIGSTARAGQFAFSEYVNVRWNHGDGGAISVAVADFNKDGRDDLAAIVDGKLQVVLQDGDGVLSARLEYEVTAPSVYIVKAVDLAADGANEILVGHSNGLSVYKWNGAGGFGVSHYSSSYPCRQMDASDLDLDGFPDVLCHWVSGHAWIYYSGAGDALESPVYMLTAVSGNELNRMQVLIKDVTGDGKPDLLMVSGASNSFFVYPHDGERGFLPAVAYAYPEEDDLWSRAIEVADVDGDGSNDVIVTKPCNRPCAELLIYKRGLHGYMYLADRRKSHDSPSSLYAHDLDGNGRQDLLVAHRGYFFVGRYMGRALGLSSFEAISDVPKLGLSFGRNAVGDLNSDGYPDFAVPNSFGVSVLYGGIKAATDFNNDFTSDLLWRHSTGKHVVWFSADGGRLQSLEVDETAWSIQATGDFDANGKAQLFWRNRTTGANKLEQLGFEAMPITSVTNQDWQVAGAGDFDGDARSDLLWRNGRTGANVIWKSGESGTQQATAAVTDVRWDVVGVGDFDGDDRSDILWRHAESGRNAVWLGGNRSEQLSIAGVSNLSWRVAGVGDFNGDGKDDVIWRNASTGANVIWLSANAATKRPVKSVTDLAWIIATVGDYNRDGRSDLVWRNVSTGKNVVWFSADSRQQHSLATVRDLRWSIIN